MDNRDGWQRLAEAVKRRREERNWTQLDIATRGPLSIDRIQSIEGARTDRYSSRTLTNLERALEWETGSVRAILDGGRPTPLESRTKADSAKAADDLTVEREPTLSEVMAEMRELTDWIKTDRKRDADRIRRLEEEVEHLKRRQQG